MMARAMLWIGFAAVATADLGPSARQLRGPTTPTTDDECWAVPDINTALPIVFDDTCPGQCCFEDKPCRYCNEGCRGQGACPAAAVMKSIASDDCTGEAILQAMSKAQQSGDYTGSGCTDAASKWVAKSHVLHVPDNVYKGLTGFCEWNKRVEDLGLNAEIIDFGASTADSNKLLIHNKVEYKSSGYVGDEMSMMEFADCKVVRAQIYVSDSDSPIAK